MFVRNVPPDSLSQEQEIELNQGEPQPVLIPCYNSMYQVCCSFPKVKLHYSNLYSFIFMGSLSLKEGATFRLIEMIAHPYYFTWHCFLVVKCIFYLWYVGRVEKSWRGQWFYRREKPLAVSSHLYKCWLIHLAVNAHVPWSNI